MYQRTIEELQKDEREKVIIDIRRVRRTGGSSLRPLLPDAESQHGKIRQNLQRRFHYENCSYL